MSTILGTILILMGLVAIYLWALVYSLHKKIKNLESDFYKKPQKQKKIKRKINKCAKLMNAL